MLYNIVNNSYIH